VFTNVTVEGIFFVIVLLGGFISAFNDLFVLSFFLFYHNFLLELSLYKSWVECFSENSKKKNR
jgi:hypothetical protein